MRVQSVEVPLTVLRLAHDSKQPLVCRRSTPRRLRQPVHAATREGSACASLSAHRALSLLRAAEVEDETGRIPCGGLGEA